MKGKLTIRELRDQYVTSMCVSLSYRNQTIVLECKRMTGFDTNEALTVRELRRQCISHPDGNLAAALQCKLFADLYMNGALAIR